MIEWLDRILAPAGADCHCVLLVNVSRWLVVIGAATYWLLLNPRQSEHVDVLLKLKETHYQINN